MRVGRLRVGGLLDRYVAKLFLLSYLSAFFLIVGLFLIIDMALNIDSFTRRENGIEPTSLDVAHYYVLQIPFLYLQMSPYVTLVAGMFTAAKMTRLNEVVAVLGAGVGLRRLLAPVLVGAALLAGSMFVLREWATAELGVRRDLIFDYLHEHRPYPVYKNLNVRDRTQKKVRIAEYRPATTAGTEPTITHLTCNLQGDSKSIVIVAKQATPLAGGRWRLEGSERQEADDQALRITHPEVLDEVLFTPADVELAQKARERPMDLSFSESRDLLSRDPTNAQYLTLFHYHVTFPLAGLVLLAVGLPFVLGQERGKAGERIAKGFCLCMLYFGGEFIARTLGLQGQIGPLFAAWIPVIGFGALGAVLFGSMRS